MSAAEELSRTDGTDGYDEIAPDGSRVRLLGRVAGGSMAEFELLPGEVSIAQRHRTVSELWYVVAGRGRMWRQPPDGPPLDDELNPGVALDIPVGTAFQFRCDGSGSLRIVGATMPPWPGDGEAIATDGPWPPALHSTTDSGIFN